jgi:hypothetical protein
MLLLNSNLQKEANVPSTQAEARIKFSFSFWKIEGVK